MSDIPLHAQNPSPQTTARRTAVITEDSFRMLAYHLPQGLTMHEIILDNAGNPADYLFLDVNPEFERMTGLKRDEVIGKRVLEVFPNTEKYWIEQYGKVALTGEPSTFENYSCELGRFYRVIAYGFQNNRFAVIIDDITEERQIRLKLEENRQTMARLLKNLPGIAYRCKYDPVWPMDFISQGCLNMTGYSDSEFYEGKITWGSLIQETDRNYVFSEITKSIEQKKSFQFEYRIRNRNGRIKWVWEKGTGIYDLNGNVSTIEGFITDITERRVTEDALTESMKSYRDLIDGMNETIWIIDLEGNIVDVNRTAISMLGYTKEELLSIGLKGIDSSLNEKLISDLIKSMPNDGIQMFETSHKSKSGRVFPVEIYSSLINYHGRKSILSIARNISRRKRDEAIQQILFEIAKTSAYAGDLDDLITSFYDRFLEVFDAYDLCVALIDNSGTLLREAGGKLRKCREWKVENSFPGMVLRSGEPLILALEDQQRLKENINLSEHDFPLLWAGVPLHDNGIIMGVVIIWSMREKPYDESTKRLLETIAHEIAVVLQRKRNIHDLIAAKNKAEESDRLKTAFLANISHEIRTPMNGILGFLDLLRMPNLDDSRKERFIELVNVSGQRLLETINKIIETAKLEAGQVEIDYSVVNIEEIMLYHFDFFQQQAIAKKLRFELKSGYCGKKTIWTDQFKLNSILTNLLNNAFKFTREGRIELGYYQDNDRVVFYVKDTGIGIPADKIDSVFERFVQADTNVTRPYEGSGLGLSIVKSYLKLFGGEIHVESEVGKGSTFYFSIPMVSKEKSSTGNDDFRADIQQEHKGLKILVAEDDPVSIEYMKTILDDRNMLLLFATNGLDVIRMVNENPDISLILMDIKMPEMSGLDAALKIREFNKTVPIIAQSAHAFSNDKIRALESGCNNYISKPVNRSILLGLINKYMNPD